MPSAQTYSTSHDAVKYLIVPPLIEAGEDPLLYDLDSIARGVLTYETHEDGNPAYSLSATEDEFWVCVAFNVLDIVVITDNSITTASESPEVLDYIRAIELNEQNAWRDAHPHIAISSFVAPHSQATYERLVPVTICDHAD